MKQIYKYPKTYHLEGSGLNSAKKAQDRIPFREIASRHLVVEEKMDGANVGISFGNNGEMSLQSRGHFLTGGTREKHFSLFKQWAYSIANELYSVIGDRYILYGEWLYAKHTIFYNNLPHYFLEYDVLDLATETFLDTNSRHKLLQNLEIKFVPVLYSGKPSNYAEITNLVGKSSYIQTGHIKALKSLCRSKKIDRFTTNNATNRQY